MKELAMEVMGVLRFWVYLEERANRVCHCTGCVMKSEETRKIPRFLIWATRSMMLPEMRRGSWGEESVW